MLFVVLLNLFISTYSVFIFDCSSKQPTRKLDDGSWDIKHGALIIFPVKVMVPECPLSDVEE